MNQCETRARVCRRLWPFVWAAAWLCGLAVGCDGPRPAAQEQITALRILAVQATPPTALPGAEIQLKALVASPWVQPVTYEWYACAAPGDLNTGCAGKDNAVSLGQGETARYTIPKDYLPAKPSALEAFRGRYLPITLVVKAGPLQQTATKRVVVALLQSNANPTLQELQLFQGEQKSPLTTPLRLAAGSRCELRPVVAKDARQSYTTVDTKGQLHQVDEDLFLTWYVTGGSLGGGRTSDHDAPNKAWTLPLKLPPEIPSQAHVYVILRDGRGGVDWRHQVVDVQQ